MNKIKISLYAILIALFPIVFVVVFGYITKHLEMLAARTFQGTAYMTWVNLSNLFAGCMFAVIAFLKEEYYKNKLILISHLFSICILIVLFAYISIDAFGIILSNFALSGFSPHLLRFVKIENLMLSIGFMIFALIKAFILKRKI